MVDDSSGQRRRPGTVGPGAPGRDAPARAGPNGAERPLEFPRVARLALDELLDELVDRIGEVKATQGRLRGLLAATHHIAAALDLDQVLQRIVESARTLTGAGSAALGILDADQPDKLVHTGMTAEQVAAIRALPPGAGVPGLVLAQPEPMRIDDLSAHPAAAGFAAQHPPDTSFLGTPVRVRGTVFGVLFLTGAGHGRFSADDEELVVALASAAGLAIQNALLYNEARRRERWQTVSAQITRALLAEGTPASGTGPARRADHVSPALDDGRAGLGDGLDGPAPGDRWQSLLELAASTAQAQGGAVCAVDLHRPDTVEVVATVGMLDGWAHHRVKRAGSLTEVVLDTEGPVTIDDSHHDPRTAAAAERVPEMRHAVGIRLTAAEGETPRVMVLIRGVGQSPFGPLERDMLAGFADHVATAVALQQTRRERAAARRAENSERLARHLNDDLMGALMRLSLDLASLTNQVPHPAREQVLEHIDTVDHLVRGIRDTVYDLDIP